MVHIDRRKGWVRRAEAAVVAAALRYKRAKLAGDEASIVEDTGEGLLTRSSDSWYEEALEHEQAMFEALEPLEEA